jgi:hypothetical protein
MTRLALARQAFRCDNIVSMRFQTVCPKCQRERMPAPPGKEDACARCGLLVARWDGFKVEIPSLPPLDAAWADLQNRWADDDAHRKFLDLAADLGGLDLAAAHYRTVRDERPSDVRAEAGLRRASNLAQSLYAAHAQADRTRTPSGALRAAGLVGAIVVVLAAMWAFYFVFTRR